MSLYELEQISLAVMKDYKLKQKQHILNLFVQLYNAYVTEVQDMVDELRYFYESQERTLSSPNYISPSKSNIDQNYDSQIEEDPMVDFPLDLSKHHQPVTVDVQPQIHENLVLINKQSESNDDDSTDDEDRTKTLIQSLNSKTLINSAKSPVLGSIHPAPYIVENKHDDSNIIEKSTIIEASPDLLRRCTSTTTMNPFMNVKLPKKQRNDDWKMSKDVSNKQSTSLSPIPKRKKISSKKNKSNSKTSISSHLKQTTMTQVFDKIDKSTLPVQQLQFMLPLPVTRKLILPTVNYRKQSGQSKFILTGKKSSDANESLVIISATEQKQKRLLSPRKEQQLASEQMDTDENQNMLVLNQHVTENSYFTFDKSLIPLSLEDDHYTDKEDGYKENRNQAPFVQFDFDDETIVNKMPLRSLNGNDTTMAPYYGQNQTTTSPDLNDNNDDELLYICRACRDYWICLPDQLKKNYRCKHRQRPIITTPQHFWSLGVPNTQTCLERGYGGVRSPTEPTERLRRPRRQFQQQEENALNNNILLDDE